MCLNRRAASSPHQRQSLSVQRQLDSAGGRLLTGILGGARHVELHGDGAGQ